MIVKTAKPYRHAGALAKHLLKTEENEAVHVLGGRDMVEQEDVSLALKEMVAQSRGARCQNPLYHVAFNAAPGEHLNRAQWERCLALWEREAGLEGHQRLVVQHEKAGRIHTHAVYNRLDPESGLAVSVWQDHPRAKAVARQIERELGLQRVPNERPAHRAGQRQAEPWEAQQARRTGTNINETRDAIRQAYELSDNGKTFRHALRAQGYELATGDRRAFLVVDDAGNYCALNGRVLPGERQRTIRERLGDLEPDALPNLEAARELQSELVKKREKERGGKSGEGERVLRPDGAPTPAADLTDRYRSKHVAINAQERKGMEQRQRQAAELAKTHERDLARVKGAKPKRRLFGLLAPSKAAMRDHEQKLVAKEAQRAKDAAELERKARQEAKAIEAERLALRRKEQNELALLKRFEKSAKRGQLPDANAQRPAAEQKPKPRSRGRTRRRTRDHE